MQQSQPPLGKLEIIITKKTDAKLHPTSRPRRKEEQHEHS